MVDNPYPSHGFTQKVFIEKDDQGKVLTWIIECPACRNGHGFIPGQWMFNCDVYAPTFTPSFLAKTVTPSVPAGRPDAGQERICHCKVHDGKIEYLSDCTHEYAGQTLELGDID